MHKLKISVIGLRGHAQRHIQSLLQRTDIELINVLYDRAHAETYADLPLTNTISDCLGSDAIIISSPTHTHYSYMQLLRDFSGYILLEKPAVNTPKHIESLIQFPECIKTRTRINFNFVFHGITAILEDLVRNEILGKIFALDVHTAHGVAFKPEWQGSWRIKSESGLGPIETTGIHFLHLAERLFGNTTHAYVDLLSLSNSSEYYDTGTLHLSMESNVKVRLRHSYAAPYRVHIEAHGTDGYFIYDGEKAYVYGPRDTFDNQGLYTNPPAIKTWVINYPSEWDLSLVRSQSAFLEDVRDQKRFDSHQFDHDVKVMNTMIDAIRL